MKSVLLASIALFSSLTLTSAQLSSLAQQLGLNQTWYAPFPSSPITDSTDAASDIKSQWSVPSTSTFFGTSNLEFIQDPFNNSSNDSAVLQVFYPQGSYSPSASKTKGASSGGAEFYAQPLGNISYDRALVSYSVGFPANFPWTLGGKLPGIYGGSPGAGCSGGDQSTGSNCFSMRIMWRQNDLGEAYAYIPTSSDFCSQSLIICNDDYGKSIGRGLIQFVAGEWNKIDLYIQLNTVGSSNGLLQVWQNGKIVINMNDLQYHTTNMVLIESFMFSTFFGGSTSSYAAPQDTYTYFKDIQFSVGTPVPLSASVGISRGSLRSLPALVAVVMGVVAVVTFVV
ncbi:polysaccharide lyase family 14 protein [Endogone sp. FLAS-F59071]|nr:polysaccharide lyase family 14 protein [Endogone sp. FLAS-F59071]|eukprot:RUS21689.1 polysaccharide lyase family 14 protein [Endogone sp. FLAS-F59071]